MTERIKLYNPRSKTIEYLSGYCFYSSIKISEEIDVIIYADPYKPLSSDDAIRCNFTLFKIYFCTKHKTNSYLDNGLMTDQKIDSTTYIVAEDFHIHIENHDEEIYAIFKGKIDGAVFKNKYSLLRGPVWVEE